MRTLKLTIAYDGTRYAGWQVQQRRGTGNGARGTGKPTIQGTLETVLRRILQEPVKVAGSGRTDAGVHAMAQVAHVRIRSRMPPARLLRSLNRLLPADIAVTRIEEAPAGFHARFDAARKRYRYRIATGPVVDPFTRPYVHHVPAALNTRLMQREASALNGRHDFGAFANAGSVRRSGSIRAITIARVRRRGGEIHLDLEGNGFLHTMARSIAGTLIDVGRGRLPAGTVKRLLRTRARSGAGTTAPARGLTLVSVTYGR
jgi:tRNA pseudouridine38-40 synthase